MDTYKGCIIQFNENFTYYWIEKDEIDHAGGPCINHQDGIRIAHNYIDLFL